MEKLQLMMFEAIGYKLKFSQKVTERYLDVLGVPFGKKLRNGTADENIYFRPQHAGGNHQQQPT